LLRSQALIQISIGIGVAKIRQDGFDRIDDAKLAYWNVRIIDQSIELVEQSALERATRNVRYGEHRGQAAVARSFALPYEILVRPLPTGIERGG
jgi:hypothetical protein